jgi:hypothetical protein
MRAVTSIHPATTQSAVIDEGADCALTLRCKTFYRNIAITLAVSPFYSSK